MHSSMPHSRKPLRLVIMALGLALLLTPPALACDRSGTPRLLDVMTEALSSARQEHGEIDHWSGEPLSEWMAEVLAPHRGGMPIELWVVSAGGEIVFSDQAAHQGQTLAAIFGAEAEGVEALADALKREVDGCAEFAWPAIPGQAPWPMAAWWRSVPPATDTGQAWRVLSAHLASLAGRTPPPDAPHFDLAGLQALAQDEALIEALGNRDDAAAMGIFESVVISHRGIYSLGWIDAEVVQRFGFPPENSLFEVDIKQFDFPTTPAFVAAIQGREVFSYEANLLEGGRGQYTVVPIGSDEAPLGALLWLSRF